MATNERDWVKARASCTLDDIFKRIKTRVEQDVKTYNQLPAHRRGTRRFAVSFNNGECIINRQIEVTDHRGIHVTDDPEYTRNVITICCADKVISVNRREHMNFNIHTRWNEDNLTCDLLIDDNPLSLSKISQRILGDFLFEE